VSLNNSQHGDRFRAAFSGVEYAVVRDQRVRYKVIISIVFLLVALLFDDWLHFLVLLAVTGLMVVAEVFNSAIAALCDYVQPRYDTLVSSIKDMALAASWVAVFIWTANILIVLYELVHLMKRR
jgi:diacylglycerol kinase